ncbi:MAG: SIMPL domain-containing protein [Mangrovibacterium sp.]
MKDLSWVKIALVSVAIVAAGYLIGNMHKNAVISNRSVEVKGLSEREVLADKAVWPLQITLAGNELKQLQATIDAQTSEVKAFFEALGFGPDEMSMGTTNIDDARTQMYGGDQASREFRYITKIDFTIRTSKIDKLQEALDKSSELLTKGIIIGAKNPWQPIEYVYTKLNEIKPPMIEEATKNAREVAEKFAKDSNSRVGKIKGANQGLFSITDRDLNSPQIKVIRVVTTIDYFIED